MSWLLKLIQLIGLDGAIRIAAYGGALIGVITFIVSIQNIRADNADLKHRLANAQSTIKVRELELSLNKQALGTLSKQCKAQADRFLKEHDIWKKIDSSKDPLTDAANFR